MRKFKTLAVALVILLASSALVFIGHVTEPNPSMVYAEVTEDELDICIEINTDIYVPGVDLKELINCLLLVDSD